MCADAAFQAILLAPCGKLGVRCTAAALTGVEFLPPDTPEQPPRNALAAQVAAQLAAYFSAADFAFDLPLAPGGTLHQNRVWQRMCAIPRGQALTYGELARDIGSAPRAVGQACGNNPIPIVIPCHRVVGRAGLGGFMHHGDGYALEIKRWLLRHEGYLHD
ncbi:methylated-DNA--[protein]-cysteine S-methyltransferase [Ferriphaselus sp. R-1]|uniref:methylated-DNA--[protein]-cysteine S-methyltransferase n=1 Tax=Ferriphaselus sp. R-1 TaxID=1485544 RepID=UPI000552F4DB|nr:methylated-DNA--[protein]-cysteine S-methyltransferase [Ferriphaselus sp. R-1]